MTLSLDVATLCNGVTRGLQYLRYLAQGLTELRHLAPLAEKILADIR